MLRSLVVSLGLLSVGFSLDAQTSALTVPPESPRWALQGNAKATEHLGRKALRLDGGAAVLEDFVFRDGVIEFDVATPASRGFFGVQFRIDSVAAEEVYLRQHKSGLPDAMQYTPVLNGGRNWQLYSGPGFTGAVDIPKDVWFHVRLEVTGAQARLFVRDMTKPALVIPDLKSGSRNGALALFSLIGETYLTNVQITSTSDATWKRQLPAMAPNALTRWSLSPSFDALARDLEKPLSAEEVGSIAWEPIVAEAPGIVPINRYRQSPRLRVTFQSDFSTRLDPQPGMKVVYARAVIDSDREETRKLLIGYSDDVSVFLNGKILYRGRSAQSFRDPGFLGIVDPENDIVYLPLKRGTNELILAVSELGGGWGFACRLERFDP